MIKKFHVKNPMVEAVQVSASNRDEVCKWINGGVSGLMGDSGNGGDAWFYKDNGDSEFYLDGLIVCEGHWIIKTDEGLFSAWTDDNFQTRFSPEPDHQRAHIVLTDNANGGFSIETEFHPPLDPTSQIPVESSAVLAAVEIVESVKEMMKIEPEPRIIIPGKRNIRPRR